MTNPSFNGPEQQRLNQGHCSVWRSVLSGKCVINSFQLIFSPTHTLSPVPYRDDISAS